MNILEEIKEDIDSLRKAGRKSDVQILITLFAEIERVGKDKGNRVTTDEEAVAIIKKFIENNKITISYLSNPSKAAELEGENILYKFYLPKQLTEDEMRHIINTPDADGQMLTTLPLIMKFFKDNHAGQYDGKILSGLARSLVKQ
jgi:uncharacterized protein YqeY